MSWESFSSTHGIMKQVTPPSEEEHAKALAKAVADYAADGMEVSPPPLDAIQGGLEDLLFLRGSDGILELSASRPRSTFLILLCTVIWVETQTLGPVEAEFHLDAGSVKAFTVRAGDGRVSRQDAPGYPLESWRKRLRFLEGRPTVDQDWEHVLRYEFE